MGVAQVVTCDCCGAEARDASVLHVATLTYLDEASGVVAQKHYGLACGCAQAIIQQHHDGLDHADHPAPPPPPTPPVEFEVNTDNPNPVLEPVPADPTPAADTPAE